MSQSYRHPRALEHGASVGFIVSIAGFAISSCLGGLDIGMTPFLIATALGGSAGTGAAIGSGAHPLSATLVGFFSAGTAVAGAHVITTYPIQQTLSWGTLIGSCAFGGAVAQTFAQENNRPSRPRRNR